MVAPVSAMQQRKLIAPGEVKSWDLDHAAMASCAEWSREAPELLANEMWELVAAFPTLIATVGRPLGEDRCWVEAAEPLLAEDGELYVFERGIRHVITGHEPEDLPQDAINGFILRVPTPIDDRPFFKGLKQRLAHLEETDATAAGLWKQALMEVKGRHYLAPRFAVWFSQVWPHSDPPVMVYNEYFEMLDIPADHVYFADDYYRLCLFANWREQSVAEVLKNRVVPRLLIDLLVADLQALGKLEEALQRLDASLYELYNVVGRPGRVEPLRKVYRELVGLDVPA
ncbi:MAG: hypothetical protein JRH20_11860 [Deltaproteobacteria bacterium]|nr:hypothetical protein [Deltaproteobacteria bacterium]